MELAHSIYEKNNGANQFRKTQIVMGEVDFLEMKINVENEDGMTEVFDIKKGKENERRRPDAVARHQP